MKIIEIKTGKSLLKWELPPHILVMGSCCARILYKYNYSFHPVCSLNQCKQQLWSRGKTVSIFIILSNNCMGLINLKINIIHTMHSCIPYISVRITFSCDINFHQYLFFQPGNGKTKTILWKFENQNKKMQAIMFFSYVIYFNQEWSHLRDFSYTHIHEHKHIWFMRVRSILCWVKLLKNY